MSAAMLRARARARERPLQGAAMVVGTSVTIQLAAAIAHGVFSALTPAGVSAIRFLLGALILFPLVRPRLLGRGVMTWSAIVLYGTSLAVLNVTFFQAISRIPMGIAVTFSFVPPLAMALIAAQRRRDAAWAVLAGVGVITLGGIGRPTSTSGVFFAIAAGCAWVGVAYAGRSVGRLTNRVDGLALAIPIAALITLPLAIHHLAAVNTRTLLIGFVIAIGGLIIPFALELEALRRLDPRVVAVIYSIDPAVAAIVGLLTLGERLNAVQVVGMIAVMAASAGVTLAAGRDSARVG